MTLLPMPPMNGFLLNSNRLYKIAKDAYYKAKQGFAIHTQYDTLVAIVFAALSLEAFINELGSLAMDAQVNGNNENFLADLVNAIDESRISNPKDKTTQAKFFNAINALSQEFDKGKRPYQDFADLFTLRNCLVHPKPEDRLEIDQDNNWTYSERKIIDRLRSKNILSDLSSDKSLLQLISNPKAAKWACDIAAEMVIAILDKIPESQFSRDNQVIAYYRMIFQSLDVDEQSLSAQEHQNRRALVSQIDKLRASLLEKYGEFPDTTELILEDRSQ